MNCGKKIFWSDSDETDEESPRKLIENDERRCKYCVKLFRNKSNVENHEKKCKIALNNTEEIVKTKDGINRFLCKICYRTFKFLTGLKKHKLRHKSPGGYECKSCNVRYCTDFELQKHKEIMHMVYKCKICKDKLNTREKYVEHILNVHDGRDCEYAVCENCGEQFRTRSILSYHKQSMCGTVKPFKCDQCGSYFQNQWSLKNHLLIHKGEKKFCCSYCGNSFINKGQLIVHERKHTKEKPYVCNVCSKAFPYRESLVTHSSIHTGIKPYLCEACGACFSCFGNLQKHRRNRPNTCGQPQYSKNAKIAPRASFKSGKLIKQIKVRKGNLVLDDSIKRIKNNSEQIEKSKNIQTETDEILKTENANEEQNQIIESTEFKTETEETTYEIINESIIRPKSKDNLTDSEKNSLKLGNSNDDLSSNKILVIKVKSSKQFENEQVYEIKIDSNDSSNSFDDCVENLLEDIRTNDSYHSNENSEKEQIEKLLDFKMAENDDNVILEKNFKEKLTKEKKNEEKLERIDNDIDDDDNEDDIPLSKIKCDILSKKENDIDNGDSIKQEVIEKKRKNMKDNKKLSPSGDSKKKSDKKKSKHITGIKNTNHIFECDKCPKFYYQRKSYVNHLVNDHSMNIFDVEKSLDKTEMIRCRYCAKIYNQMASLKKHEKLHGPDGKLIHKCSCCKKYFQTTDEAKSHAKIEHANLLTCNICQKIYTGIEALILHRKRLHQNDNPIKSTEITTDDMLDNQKNSMKKVNMCQKCGRKFVNKTTLNNHERSDCGRNPLYKCDLCEKRFHSAGTLKTHHNIHTKKTLWNCSYCYKTFTTYGQVKVHERKHNGVKPFKCDLCDKAFGYRESLLTHMSTHTGVKRYTCYGCGQRFSCISNLQNHRRTHRDTCGTLSLNSKPIATMGFDRGILYIGRKPDD